MKFLFTKERAKDIASQLGTGSEETAESIKAKYESNANTNAFTDTLKKKVDDMEPALNINGFTTKFKDAVATGLA